MPTLPLETAIVAARIGLAGGLIGQFIAAAYGARYAAELSRKTQRELDALGFQRHWREQLVRPFLELVTQRLALTSESTAQSQTATSSARWNWLTSSTALRP